LGLIASAGALSLIKLLSGATEYPQIREKFQIYLALFEMANFILIFLIAQALNLKRALWIAALIVVLPSAWAGGALWTQIDVVQQFFLLLCVFFLILTIQWENVRDPRRTVFLAAGFAGMLAFVLTKQPAIFSLAALAFLLGLAVLKLWKTESRGTLLTAAVSMLCIATFFMFLDTRLDVPEGYGGSSYLYMWLGGASSQGSISGNGFNIWMLLGKPMGSSSKEPFECVSLGTHEVCLTPFHSGLFLYVVYILGLSAVYSVLCLRLTKHGAQLENGNTLIIASLLLFLAQSNLGFNVLLAGTHERYLYNFYPFLLLSGFYFYQIGSLSWRSILFFTVAACSYGGFVYSMHHELSGFLFAFRRHEFLATIHLMLMIYLLLFSFSVLQSTTHLAESHSQGLGVSPV
jgi:hypothetical protein